MQSPSEIFSQINSFFAGKIRKKSSDSLTSPSPEEEEDEEDSDSVEAVRTKKKTRKVRRYSETTNCYRKQRGYRATVSRHSQSAVNFMRMAKQDIKLNLKRLSFGDNTPPALPARHFSIEGNDDLPPPIPERKCSLECFLDVEFERRFTFRPMSTCRLPEPFTDCKKTYPSSQPRRKALQRPVEEPPPPPPPQDTSLSSPDSPNAVFSLASPPFKLGGGGGGPGGGMRGVGVRKISNHQNQNGANASRNRISGGVLNGSQNRLYDDQEIPLPPPPPDPFIKHGSRNQNVGQEDDEDDSSMYSKAQKRKSKSDVLFQNRQNGNDDSEDISNWFDKLNESQNSINSAEIPPLPPSLIPPPPSKPLPPPPPKPGLLTRTNSNQQLVTPTNTSTASHGMRNSTSTMFSSYDADNRRSLINEISNGSNDTKSSVKTQRSISTSSPPPPPLPSKNSLISLRTKANGLNSLSPNAKTNRKNESLLDVESNIRSPRSSPSSKSKKLAMSPLPSPPSSTRPQLPPKKESLMNNNNHSLSSLSSSSSTRPLSSSFSQAAFSSYPLPQPPPSPTTQSMLPPPPPTPPPLSATSSSSSITSQRKLSGNKNRPLPPPPSSEDPFLENFRKSYIEEKDYGEGWGGKEAFDPREEDGDIYDLMDSTNM